MLRLRQRIPGGWLGSVQGGGMMGVGTDGEEIESPMEEVEIHWRRKRKIAEKKGTTKEERIKLGTDIWVL